MIYAHASEHDKLIPIIFSHKVNETAYHFLLKYILYLKRTNSSSFWNANVLKNDDWWRYLDENSFHDVALY